MCFSVFFSVAEVRVVAAAGVVAVTGVGWLAECVLDELLPQLHGLDALHGSFVPGVAGCASRYPVAHIINYCVFVFIHVYCTNVVPDSRER